MPRKVLVAVTGLSPQIVTETLFALACQGESPWVPDEIHLITTVTGAEHARLNLLTPTTGWFHRLRADYALPPIAFDENSIHVMHDELGKPMEDIRTPAQNTAAADFMTEALRTLTRSPDTAVHVSIAGGRKTMGFYIGYALSLFGRPQDRLSHVLVSDPFESNRDFYYPTPHDHPIHVRRGDREVTYNARHATVELAEIPFVSLRHGLPADLLDGRASFGATVAAAQAALGAPELRLDAASLRVRAAGKTFRLSPAEFALLTLFAHRARSGAEPMRAPLKDIADTDWSAEALRDIAAACGSMQIPASVEAALTEGADEAYFSQHLSRLRKQVRAALGPAAGPYLIEDGGNRPRRYRLALPPESVVFECIAADDPFPPTPID